MSSNEMKFWFSIRLLMAVVLLTLIVTTSVRFVASNTIIYEFLFARNNVSELTGIQPSDLSVIAEQVKEYLTGDRTDLNIKALVYGEAVRLFTAAELSHMYDVRHLFSLTFQTQLYSFFLLLVVFALSLLRLKKRVLLELALWFQSGSLLCFSAIAVVGIASLVAFPQLFELFHMVGFPQGNYRFDSNTSFLVQIFPLGFWREITILIGLISVFSSLIGLLVAFYIKRQLRGI
ncbi:MAG: DUF1461 domain-containing protein [Gammaproteobacteria bacterium]|nr:DUF1461 domain-containing protein [Gammaproteobacteria bacterium]